MAEYIRYAEYKRRKEVWRGVQMIRGARGAEAFQWAHANLEGMFTNIPEFLQGPRDIQYTFRFSNPDAAVHFRLRFKGTPV